MTYSSQEVIAALKASTRRWTFEYRLLDWFGNHYTTPRMVSGSIENNDLADVKRTAKFLMNREDADSVNFTTDKLQPIIKLQMPDGGWQEWPMGVFLLDSPQQKYTPRNIEAREINAFDLGLILRTDLVTDRFTISKGSSYVDQIYSLLTGAGIVNFQIAGNEAVLTNDLEWDPGTSKAVIINELLAAINYSSLSFDGNGVAVAGPYQAPSEAPSIYAYNYNDDGVVLPDPGFLETLDYSSVPNVFVLYVSNPDSTPLRSVYINSNPNSPVSTVSRQGRQVVSFEQVNDIADQATLDAAVRKKAEEASQVFAQVEFTSGMIPLHTTADVMYLDWGNGAVKYRETLWSMDLKAGAPMTHQVRRVVQV